MHKNKGLAMDEQFAKVKTGGLRLKGEKVRIQQILLIILCTHCNCQVKKQKKHKKSKKREREDGDGEEELEVKKSKKEFKEDSIKHGGW